MRKTVAQQIKEVRTKNKLSQDRFAKKIGVTGKTVSAYETGRCMPPLKVLENIANIYDASVITITDIKRDELSNKLREIQKHLEDVKKIIDLSI